MCIRSYFFVMDVDEMTRGRFILCLADCMCDWSTRLLVENGTGEIRANGMGRSHSGEKLAGNFSYPVVTPSLSSSSRVYFVHFGRNSPSTRYYVGT